MASLICQKGSQTKGVIEGPSRKQTAQYIFPETRWLEEIHLTQQQGIQTLVRRASRELTEKSINQSLSESGYSTWHSLSRVLLIFITIVSQHSMLLRWNHIRIFVKRSEKVNQLHFNHKKKLREKEKKGMKAPECLCKTDLPEKKQRKEDRRDETRMLLRGKKEQNKSSRSLQLHFSSFPNWGR